MDSVCRSRIRLALERRDCQPYQRYGFGNSKRSHWCSEPDSEALRGLRHRGIVRDYSASPTGSPTEQHGQRFVQPERVPIARWNRLDVWNKSRARHYGGQLDSLAHFAARRICFVNDKRWQIDQRAALLRITRTNQFPASLGGRRTND